MRWGLDLLLALAGILMGLLSAYGLTSGFEWVVSVLVWVVMALVIGQFAGGKYFLNGFVTGIVFSLLQSVVVYSLFDTYWANNPKLQDVIDKVAAAGVTMSQEDVKSRTIIWAPVGALFSGAILGLLALGAGKIFGKKPVPPVVSDAEPLPMSDTTDETSTPPSA